VTCVHLGAEEAKGHPLSTVKASERVCEESHWMVTSSLLSVRDVCARMCVRACARACEW